MNQEIQKLSNDNPTMNRKERRRAKRSKTRKAAIAMIAAGLLALSPTISTDVIADASDDLAIYGGGGGGVGTSSVEAGGGGGYVSYGDNYDFAGGANGYSSGPINSCGGGVGGGGVDESKMIHDPNNVRGGGNYLYGWCGIGTQPGIGPREITGTGANGAPSHYSLSSENFGVVSVVAGGPDDRRSNGGSAQLSLTNDIIVNNIEVLAGDCGYTKSYFFGKGGEAKLLASTNQITVHGNVVIASGESTPSNGSYTPTGGGLTVDVNDFYFTGINHDFEVFNAGDNLDVSIDKLTLADGANLNVKFIDSINNTDIKGIHFKGDGKITFTIEGTGSFPSTDSYKSIITTDNNKIPAFELSNQNKTMTITLVDPPASKVKSYAITFNANKGKIKKNGKYKSTKLTKTYTYGNKYGTLPKVKRTGYKFKGWYTKKSGGKKITSKSTMAFEKNTTLYARWTPNAKIVNCKTVHLRKSAGKPKVIKANVKKGTKVAILKTVKVSGKGKWYKVTVGSKTGYIQTKYAKRV